MYGTRIYDIWRDMRNRCYLPNIKNYKYYGGRGITVCSEWIGDKGFQNFYNWALTNGYNDSLTIDRIDVDGNYEPDNCRWVTKSVQNANRRNMGECEYIGVYRHGKYGYSTSIKYNNERVLVFSSRSKNECAEARNKFIIDNDLPHPLNEIKEEYEDIVPYDIDKRLYIAIDKQTGKAFENKSRKALAKELGISPQFIYQCCVGQRNSKKYIFTKEVRK